MQTELFRLLLQIAKELKRDDFRELDSDQKRYLTLQTVKEFMPQAFQTKEGLFTLLMCGLIQVPRTFQKRS